MTKDEFIELLASDDRGKIIICNILDGLSEVLYNEDYVKEFFDCWISLCNFKNYINVSKILLAMNTLVSAQSPPGFRMHIPKPVFKYICFRKTRLINDDSIFATVVSAYIFSHFIIHEDNMSELIAKGVKFPSDNATPMEDDALLHLMNLPAALRQIRLKTGKSIGGTKLVWFTMDDRIRNLLSKPINHADEIRDALGLIHRTAGTVLIALHVSGKVLKNIICARPTFADATTHERFKVKADSITNRKRSSWGHTVHLRSFAKNKTNIDGLPERIAAPINVVAMANAPVFSFTPLGRVSYSLGTGINDNNAAFAHRLMAGRNKNQLKRRILSII